jgi:hypothetical protein
MNKAKTPPEGLGLTGLVQSNREDFGNLQKREDPIDWVTSVLIAKGLPSDDDSSALRGLKLTSGNMFRGLLSEVLEDVVRSSCQSKSPTYIASYRRDAKLIITNLIVACFQGDWLGLGTRVLKGSHLYQLGLSRRRIENIVKALLRGGYAVQGRRGYLHQRNPSKSRATQYYPTEKLLRAGAEVLYETVGDFDNYSPYVWESGDRWDVNEAANIQILRDYNEFMRSHSWAQKAPSVRKLLSKPYTGGRVYTPYQNIVNRRAPVRSKTLLDWEPLVECDFSANHPYMLARLTGNDFNPNFYHLIADASRTSREEVKAVITASIGCSSPTKAHQARYELVKRGIELDSVDGVISAAKTTHRWLEDHNIFFSNKGVYMQWLEGEIAMKMFAYALQTGIPMINVHDGYAVNHVHADEVQRAMSIAREQVLEENESLYSNLHC